MNYISKLELDGSTAPIGSSLFGFCSSNADAVTKVVNIPEFDEPVNGTTIFVLFRYGNKSNTMKLMVGEYEVEIPVRTRDGDFTPYFNARTMLSFTYNREPVLSSTPYWNLNEDGYRSIPICNSSSNDSIKYAYCSKWISNSSFFIINMLYTSIHKGELQLSVNGGTARTIYINGEVSSATNYNLPSGIYIGYFDGTNYYFNTDGSIPNLENHYVKKTGDTINGSLIATNWITAGTDTKESGTLLRALNGNGYAALYAESMGENPDDDHYKIGLMSSVRNHEIYDTQPILYRMTNYGKSATYLAGYDKNGNYRPYTLGAGAPQTGWFSSIPVIDSNGVMEIGRYVDFHNSDTDTSNYTFRINNTQDGKLSLSGTVNQGSSRKIKENIEDISLDEAKNILNLRPVRFDYITGSKDERGFIAEEVAEIYPNLVVPENEEFQIPASLNYIGIIPYLVKVIQDQEKRLNEQEKQIKELEK